MTKEPDWEALPRETPGALRQVLRVCLTKDAKRRVRDIADVRLAMKGAFETEGESKPGGSQPGGWRPSILGALAFALALAAVTAVVVGNLEPETPRPVTRFTIPLPLEQTGARGQLLAVSPDGSRLGVVLAGQLYLRTMDQTEMTPVAGTGGAVNPFFSPDGEWVGFWANDQIKKVLGDGRFDGFSGLTYF